jgi:predicted DsbA family dithiol-disulfide isomerase/uncharacterized membrane protein
MQAHVKKLLPVLLLAAVGIGVSLAIDVIHQRMAADVNYTSFCTVSATVDCRAVLGSRYATLWGVPVSRWALLYYGTLLAVGSGVLMTRSAALRQTLGTLIGAMALGGLVFSAYMAVIALAVVRSVCLMCSALYLVSIGLVLAAWRLRSALQITGRRQLSPRAGQDRMVMIGGAVAALALVVVAGWEAVGRGVHVPSAEEIARDRPDFYKWWFAQPVVPVRADLGQARGNRDAPVTVVEFSDFECGHCAAFHASLEQVLRRSGYDVRLVFRNFPLDSTCNPKAATRLHPDACLAAVAAECAADQGKFWEYHNLLFDHQQELSREFLFGYANRVGLDKAQFGACLSGEAARRRVEQDVLDGAQLGIDSTPTVFINGRMIRGALEPGRLADALTLARAQ